VCSTTDRNDWSTTIREVLPAGYVRTVKSRISDGRDDSLLDLQFIECLKYLAILNGTGGRRIPVTPEVDDVWHELIVQTASYARLCAALPGGRFIHHESITPLEYADRVGDHTFVAEFVQWIPDYVSNFGPFTEGAAQQWTVCRFLGDHMGMTLDDINKLGATEAAEVSLPSDSPWKELGRHSGVSSLAAS